MANADQIKALLKSHIDGNEDWFYATAMQVAAQAARQGQQRFANELKTLVDNARAREGFPRLGHSPTPISQPRGELSGLLSVAYPKTLLNDMVLTRGVYSKLSRVIKEHRQSAKLRSHGLRPRNKLLLVGPPGSGKTMTASALAGERHLPLFTILLDGLITRYMGETAAKLRLVFDAIGKTPGVYLFDEFDAIGSNRVARNDVGEIRRVLNSFLTFVEQDDSESIIIAATNFPELLDSALFRRFDDVIRYENPTEDFASEIIRARLAMFDTKDVEWEKVVESSKGLSYADVTKACEDAAKDAILRDSSAILMSVLCLALEERQAIQT